MSEIIKMPNSEFSPLEEENESTLTEISNGLLFDKTRVFIDKMDNMIQIYNHTEKICFDDKKIYLIAD